MHSSTPIYFIAVVFNRFQLFRQHESGHGHAHGYIERPGTRVYGMSIRSGREDEDGAAVLRLLCERRIRGWCELEALRPIDRRPSSPRLVVIAFNLDACLEP